MTHHIATGQIAETNIINIFIGEERNRKKVAAKKNNKPGKRKQEPGKRF